MIKVIPIGALCFLLLLGLVGPAHAGTCVCCCSSCSDAILKCSTQCGSCSTNHAGKTNGHFEQELKQHQKWLIELFFLDPNPDDPPGLLAAMMLMNEQLTVNAVQRTQIIGTFFDAKHQLETQRLFQSLTARAHKDYHPSQELCTIGTTTRSLASSERKSDLVSTAFSRRSVDRQLLSKDTLEMETGVETDKFSRLVQFIKHYCNPNDNAASLGDLCKKHTAPVVTRNKDINYTSTFDLPLTLDIDLDDPAVSDDERALFALTANLIAHETMPQVAHDKFMAEDKPGEPAYEAAALKYLNSRALVAKRSIAANSLASIAGLKAAGAPDSQPFIYAIIQELNPNFSATDIMNLLGKNPSYHAQMEVLTKKLYQHPNFYSNLYDKPANVMRKDVAIQAADLMQKRDIFRSLLRSEVTLATMLETALIKEQVKVKNMLDPGKEEVK